MLLPPHGSRRQKRQTGIQRVMRRVASWNGPKCSVAPSAFCLPSCSATGRSVARLSPSSTLVSCTEAPASAGQMCSVASAWPPAASADPAPPWPRPPPRSWPSEKSAFQPIPLCRVVGELDSGDPPFLHQLAHTGCGGQRRQLQFAHDLLDAHGRMPLQYGHNRLDHVAR